MPNYDINPTVAVQALLELIEVNDGEDVEIQPGGDIEDQVKFITSLPEAEGLIGYDVDKKVLYLIKGQN